jgi:RNA polymerase I-specific transcription initiation factor RRN7
VAGTESEEEEVEQESDKGYSSYLFTSDSDVASTTRSAKKRRQRLVPKASDRPKLVESLCLCYLGLILLRSAVLLGDFHRWVDSQHLPYIRAIRCVPEAMKDKLSAEYWSALDPKSRLRRGRLYTTVHAMVVVLHEKFGITFPPVNKELLLVRYVNELGLSLETYTAVKRLVEKLFATFEWPAMPWTKRTAHWPEARLMAIVVVATKLSYGLDGIKRIPKSSGEPAATGVKWEAWERFLRAGNEEKRGVLVAEEPRRKGGLEVDVKEADVFAMENEELDWYMDWYERTWCLDDEEGMTKRMSSHLI